MPNRTTWIEDVETLPVRGTTIHFSSRSGDESLRFAMALDTAVAVAYAILAAAEEANSRPECQIIPILGARPVEYGARA